MQDQNQKTSNPISTNNSPKPAASVSKPEASVKPAGVTSAPAKAAGDKTKAATPKTAPGVIPQNDFERRIIDKIRSSENILVALSRDPSVDEMAAAIGLTMFLDGLQKHTTAIYSGATPDALQFLQPAETFETNTDSLQDFIIALSKDKADHLRYKLEGDFVKVYITPYKTVLTENDLEFSHGDYNVDLVLALGVPQATDLDAALSEYGRIMHDATTVDITCDAPGRFGEIEWSDPGASSVSEMVTKLIFAMQGKDAVVDKEIATALLTGIVAATGRFSNDRTNSETMQLASKLMSMGADQQLISAHVMDNDTGVVSTGPSFADYNTPLPAPDEANLMVGRDYGNYTTEIKDTVVPVDVPVQGGIQQAEAVRQAQAATNSVAPDGATAGAAVNAVNEAVAAAAASVAAVNEVAAEAEKAEQAAQAAAAEAQSGPKDYGAMLAAALEEPLPMATAASAAGLIDTNPGVGAVTTSGVVPPQQGVAGQPSAQSQPAQAAQSAQPVAPAGAQPVANNASGVVLPPPPAPTTGNDVMPPVLPQVQVPADLAAKQAEEQAKAMAAQQAQASQVQQQANPGAFQIPGM